MVRGANVHQVNLKDKFQGFAKKKQREGACFFQVTQKKDGTAHHRCIALDYDCEVHLLCRRMTRGKSKNGGWKRDSWRVSLVILVLCRIVMDWLYLTIVIVNYQLRRQVNWYRLLLRRQNTWTKRFKLAVAAKRSNVVACKHMSNFIVQE